VVIDTILSEYGVEKAKEKKRRTKKKKGRTAKNRHWSGSSRKEKAMLSVFLWRKAWNDLELLHRNVRKKRNQRKGNQTKRGRKVLKITSQTRKNSFLET